MDSQHENALEAYIDKMSELLLHEKLHDLAGTDEVSVIRQILQVQKIARMRTLMILSRLDIVVLPLDASRKRSVLQFLYESGLIDKGKCKIDLSEADLGGANLSLADLHGANLRGADLREADLPEADLREADLRGADLRGANLHGANLRGAKLDGADLREADLGKAKLGESNLREAKLDGTDLRGANLKNATDITTEQLDKAKSLQGATMPDGSTHP